MLEKSASRCVMASNAHAAISQRHDLTALLRTLQLIFGYEIEPWRKILLERTPASGERRVGHEVAMGIEGTVVRPRRDAQRRAVRFDFPALLVVLEIGDHDLVEH